MSVCVDEIPIPVCVCVCHTYTGHWSRSPAILSGDRLGSINGLARLFGIYFYTSRYFTVSRRVVDMRMLTFGDTPGSVLKFSRSSLVLT